MTFMQKHAGWFVLAGAVFMLLVAMAGDVAGLETWASALAPAFIGSMIGHIGSVGTAWLAGKLQPQIGGEVPEPPPMYLPSACPTCGRPIGHEEHA